MFDQLVSRWWIVALRGVAAIAFGIAAFVAPERTLGILISLFGLFALAEAFFVIGAGLSMNWLSLFLDGIFGAVMGGVILFYQPAAQPWVVGPMIVAWAIVTGALEIGGAIELRRLHERSVIPGEWLLAIGGIVSLAFGVLLAVQPAETIPLAWTIGSYALLSGGLLFALAMNIRRWPRATEAQS